MMRLLIAFLTFVFFGMTLLDRSSGQSISRRKSLELVDVIETAIMAGAVISPIDVMGKAVSVNEFDDEVGRSDTIEFRLLYDSDNQTLSWALKRSVERLGQQDGHASGPGEIEFFGVRIDGGSVSAFGGRSKSAPVRYVDFENAVANASIPSFQYWGLVPFPFFGDERDEIKRLQSMIMHVDTTVDVRNSGGNLRCIARHRPGNNRLDVHTWEFEMPDHLPVLFRVDRGTSNNLRPYLEQRVIWGDFQGSRVPIMISAESGIFRKLDGRYQIGKRFADTELSWVSAGRALPEREQTQRFSSAVDVQKFLDEGRAISRQRN